MQILRSSIKVKKEVEKLRKSLLFAKYFITTDSFIYFCKKNTDINFSLMFTASNKTKTPAINLNTPKKLQEQRPKSFINEYNPESPPQALDMSFSVKKHNPSHQPRTIITNTSLNSTGHLQKILSSPNFTESLSDSSIDKGKKVQISQNKLKFTEKTAQRLKTIETFQTNFFSEENIDNESINFKISQPSGYPFEANFKPQQKNKAEQQLNGKKEKLNNSSLAFRPTTPTITSYSSQTNLKSSKLINDNRLKLKDYLFMVNTTTTIAKSKKRNLDDSLNFHKDHKKNDSKLIKTDNNKGEKDKQTHVKAIKYHITNEQMCQTLKKQIKIDINHLIKKLDTVTSWLSQAENNQQLVALCDLKKKVQQYDQQMQKFCSNKLGVSFISGNESANEIIHQYDEDSFKEI